MRSELRTERFKESVVYNLVLKLKHGTWTYVAMGLRNEHKAARRRSVASVSQRAGQVIKPPIEV
jgi:hypothetical protein